MSFDRKIDWVCPHTVAEEALFVASDKTTVRPLRPISSANSVRVRLNGTAFIPSEGISVPAMAQAERTGPFNIRQGVNDTLVVTVGSQAPQTIVAAPGEGLTSAQVAERLSVHLSGASVGLTPKRRLHIQTHDHGKAATLMIRSTGSTMASTLGLLTDRQWRGKQPVPGWSLISDPNTLADRPTRLIVFDEPLRGFRDYVELNYATIRQECRRCGGLGVENDWRYSTRGNVVEVRDEALLIQEVQKFIYTLKGSNPFHVWIGTEILNMVGRKISDRGLVQNFVVTDIREAFRRWQSVKRQQEDTVGQFVSDEEFPFNLLSVTLDQSQTDPTVVFVKVVVQNRSQRQIQIERGVRLPLPENLLGGSSQDGIIRQSLNNFVITG